MILSSDLYIMEAYFPLYNPKIEFLSEGLSFSLPILLI